LLAGDCSKSIRTGKASDNIDVESKELLKYIFDKNKNAKFDKIGIFPSKFDVVSCMFSIHYFFENEEKLDGFIKNIVENIAEKGKFILTFMDKDLVKKILEPDGKAIGKDPVSNATVWAIIRNPEYNLNTAVVYNQKIDVFIENTGRLISENLVDLKILKIKLSRFNIQFVESETFEETFNNKKTEINNIPVNKRTTQQIKDKTIIDTLNEDENLKKFSFLNRWCIFQKS
jgi:mRNA (guanine-N7-)-methyltransferase